MTSFNQSFSNRFEKKRGSVDAVIKPQRKTKNSDYRYEPRKQINQLSIDLNPQRNMKLSLSKNVTHRMEMSQNSNNLCELREQVEQLRMENESLRQQIKILKSNQSQLKIQLANTRKQFSLQQQKLRQAQIVCFSLQQKVQKYYDKIKELFESLIEEKKKNAGIDQDFSKVKMALSPSNLSICNSLNLRKFQQEGYRDFYNSSQRTNKDEQSDKQKVSKYENYQRLKKVGWSIESSDSPPPYVQRGETFGTKY